MFNLTTFGKTVFSKKTFNILLIVCMSAFGAVACEEGPAEDAGEEIDRAIENVKDGAEDAGDKLEEACEDATGKDCD